MKYFVAFLALTIVFGCKSFDEKKPEEKLMEEVVGTPEEIVGNSEEIVQEWLTMEGEKDMPHIVLVSGDEEYRSEEAMPQLAKILSEHHGFNCTVLFAQDPEKPGIVDPNYSHNIPGLEHLASADMMVLFTRFRALPDDQMKYFDDYLKSGKPLLGIRTATHAFNFDKESRSNYKHYGNFYDGDDEWKDGFGKLVLGEHWVSHYGKHAEQSTRGLISEAVKLDEIVKGISNGDIWGPTDVYGIRLPLPQYSKVLVVGQIINRAGPRDDNDPLLGMRPTDSEMPGPVEDEDLEGNKIMVDRNDPMMPIVWTNSYQIPNGIRGRSVTSTIGSSTDMLSQGVRRVLVNSVYWGLKMEVPDAANVSLIGNYKPTRFAFRDDAYWDERNIKIARLAE